MLNSCGEPSAASDAPDYGDEPLSASQSSDFAPHRDSVKSIDLRSLRPGTKVVVNTRNSRYNLVMCDGSGWNALVQGGSRFPQETQAQVEGSTLGGSALKIGWIGVGLFLVISASGKRSLTTRVGSIRFGGFSG